MIHTSHSCNNHNKNASHLANSSTSNLMFESRFTVPIVVNNDMKLSLANLNDPKCWCKKWSFDDKGNKNFDEYLRLDYILKFELFPNQSF